MKTVLFLAVALAAQAAGLPEKIEWSRTPIAFADKSVSLKLNDGTRLEGRWISVTQHALQFSVESTSNRRAVPPGIQTLPRESLGEIRVNRRRVRGRVVGTLAGFYSVALVSSAAKGREALQGPVAIVAAGAAVAGYFLGREVDRGSHPVVIIADTPRVSVPDQPSNR